MVAVVAAVILAGARWLPLAIDRYRLVAYRPATGTLILNPGQTIRQNFIAQAPGKWRSGIVLYSWAPFWDNRQILVRILDAAGHERTSGHAVETRYVDSADTLRIAIATPWYAARYGEHLTAEITLKRGAPLSLRRLDLPTRHDIALSSIFRVPVPYGAKQGAVAGVIALLSITLIALYVPQRWQWWAATACLIPLAFLGLGGFWFSLDKLGIADWDYYFSLHQTYRQTILTQHVFPFWNPWTCGGTAGLADPEFPGFTPTFLLELIFGIPVGVRLAIFFATAVGGIGMLRLARQIRLSLLPACLAALGYMFSSVNLLEIVEGHVNILAAMWLPWIFWAWLRAYRKPRQISSLFLLALFLAATFYQGGIYLLLYTGLAFILMIALASRKKAALRITIIGGVWSLGLAALKLIPVLAWLRRFPDQGYQGSTVTLPWLTDIFFGRYLHGTYKFFQQTSGWHEYGAYIGYILFGCALLGLTYLRRNRIVRGLLVAFIAALLLSSTGPALKTWFDLTPFIPRSNISRIIIFAVMAACLLAGFGLERVQRISRTRLVALVLVGFVAVDLMSLAYRLSEQAFVLPPVYPLISPAPSPIAFTKNTYDDLTAGTHRTRDYAATVAGYGTFAYCSVLGPPPMVITMEDKERDSSAISAADPQAHVTLTAWSPNRVVASVTTPRQTEVALNTNDADGWYANNQPTHSYSGRVGTTVSAGTSQIIFAYHAPGFKSGLVITVLTLLGTGGILATKKRAAS